MPRGSVTSPTVSLGFRCPRRPISELLAHAYDLQLRTTARFLLSPKVRFRVMKWLIHHLRLYPLAFQQPAIPPPPHRFDPDLTPPSCRLPPPGSRRSCVSHEVSRLRSSRRGMAGHLCPGHRRAARKRNSVPGRRDGPASIRVLRAARSANVVACCPSRSSPAPGDE